MSSTELNQCKQQKLMLKYVKTLFLSLSFMSLGISIAILGPTLPTLAYNLEVDITSISFVVPARAFGYLVGSILSGFLYGKVDVHMMILLSMTLQAIGTIFVPYLNAVILIGAALSTIGIAMGFLDTAGNVMCLQTWGDKSGPFMQTLHFSFALGTTIAPLIAQPFIMDIETDESMNTTNGANANLVNYQPLNNTLLSFSTNTSNTYVALTTDNKSIALTTTVTTMPYQRYSDVVYAFVICAVFAFAVAVTFLYLVCYHPNSSAASDQTDTVKEEGWHFRLKFLILLFMFFLIYVGMEVTFGLYLFSFAIYCENNYSKNLASYLNSAFWGSFAVGRLFAIPLSWYFTPGTLLRGDLLGTLIAAITLSCFPFYAKTADILLWLAVCLYGLSMASIFPTGISWAEEYITITGKAAVVFVVGASFGEMIVPLIVGQFVKAAPMNLMYTAVICVSLSILNYLLLMWLANTRGKRLKVALKISSDQKVNEEEDSNLMGDSYKSAEL